MVSTVRYELILLTLPTMCTFDEFPGVLCCRSPNRPDGGRRGKRGIPCCVTDGRSRRECQAPAGPTEQAGRRLRWVGKNKDAAKRLNHRNRCRYRTGEFFVIERDNDPAIHRWFDSSRPTAFSLRQQLKSHRQRLGTGKTTVLFLRPELFLSFNLVVECEVSD